MLNAFKLKNDQFHELAASRTAREYEYLFLLSVRVEFDDLASQAHLKCWRGVLPCVYKSRTKIQSPTRRPLSTWVQKAAIKCLGWCQEVSGGIKDVQVIRVVWMVCGSSGWILNAEGCARALQGARGRSEWLGPSTGQSSEGWEIMQEGWEKTQWYRCQEIRNVFVYCSCWWIIICQALTASREM